MYAGHELEETAYNAILGKFLGLKHQRSSKLVCSRHPWPLLVLGPLLVPEYQDLLCLLLVRLVRLVLLLLQRLLCLLSRQTALADREALQAPEYPDLPCLLSVLQVL